MAHHDNLLIGKCAEFVINFNVIKLHSLGHGQRILWEQISIIHAYSNKKTNQTDNSTATTVLCAVAQVWWFKFQIIYFALWRLFLRTLPMFTIGHFTVACLVTWPWMQARLEVTLLWYKPLCFSHVNTNQSAHKQLDLHNIAGLYQNRSPPASLPFKGHFTKERTVKWSI